MRDTYKNIWMWALYGLLFLLTAAVQTVVFGRDAVLGAKLCMMPVLLACVAMHTDAQGGALYGLIVGAVWCFSGADGGALHILLFSVCGAVIGYLCDRYLRRQLLCSLLMSLLALVLCQTVLFLFKFYIGTAVPAHLRQTLLQIAVSMLCCPPLYLAAWAIRKAGA